MKLIRASDDGGEENSLLLLTGVFWRASLRVSLVSESSKKVGVLQNVHRNLVYWIALRLFYIQIAVAFSYWHPSDVRQDLIIVTFTETYIQKGDVRYELMLRS
nr:hypothetical protein [Tanacetum cinerariifolium]